MQQYKSRHSNASWSSTTDQQGSPTGAREWRGEISPDTVDVTTNCTDVCGPGQWGCSCSKICLAWVYPKGHKDRASKAYVILDDQSNRSLARAEFFELFDFKN